MEVRVGVVRGTVLVDFEALLPLPIASRLAKPGYLLYGALADGAPCGVLCAHVYEGGLVLDYLYVVPSFRREGVATALLADLMGWARGRFTDIHASFLPEAEDYETGPLAQTFMSVGFLVEQSDAGFFTLPLSGIEVPEMDGLSLPNKVMPLSALPALLLRGFEARLRQSGAEGAPLEFPGNALPEVSMAYVFQKEVAGVLLAEERASNLVVSWLYARKAEGMRSARALWQMMFAALQAARHSYPPDTEVQILAINSQSEKMVQRLCPAASRASVVDALLPLGTEKEGN